jgi:hypothetical protein
MKMGTVQLLLDRVWHSKSAEDTKNYIVQASSDDKSVLQLFKLALLGNYGSWLDVVEGKTGANLFLSYKDRQLETDSYLTRSPSDLGILNFVDVGATLEATSVEFKRAWGDQKIFDFYKLVLAAQFARDQLDSITFLPNEMRRNRLSQASEELGLPVNVLVGLARLT